MFFSINRLRNIIPTLFLLLTVYSVSAAYADTVSYVRYETAEGVRYGVLSGDVIEELSGGIFPVSQKTGKSLTRQNVRLLPPTDARKVFAVGMNFASHLASSSDLPPPLFLKLPSSLIGSGETITLPRDASNVHFEGELVLIIGKQAKNVSEADANDYIFGLTAGNDLSERSWQSRDLQWMRAKASDGFGPVGPVVVTGLDPNNLLLTTRLNGETVQQENTKNMIHKPAKVVSYLSRYFTLEPGDMIFMGTPGRTKALDVGDVVTVTIDGIGTLSNQIARE
ncbi:Fumarylacetoacetate hydrolase family protein [Candidatus Terasakiella magnetica]|uniref:Fumarylacetoacetate hydrolase family protein n=1 Tax=Candidatus Terasakiella magnetica TaxID=1867952 RepID=A0A1C3RFL4_9PROT|nr:fumarylacetoacetate hydrolase family protein [Candidatus Terasakiella magnetica]SCA56045.1 Fumarylacetoacetate hydrolase family protein [Candidatus Terasakiella magnetica]